VRLRRTLFISDLHLDESRPRIVAQFENFLEETAPGCDALYILGDLFEYWVGDDGLGLPFPQRIATALAPLAERVPVRFMHGNRDFLVAQGFARATRTELIADPTAVDLYGRRALLMHGDTLCTDDKSYQAFRAQVRDPEWQRATLSRPLGERLAVAGRLRSESESAKQSKSMEIMDVAPEAVEKAFAESGCDLLIHGHTHRPGRHTYRIKGRDRVRWVLPDWYERGGYLEASPGGIRAVEAV
jgi:UDP-2,3-diacylglucosamine hydrolase